MKKNTFISVKETVIEITRSYINTTKRSAIQFYFGWNTIKTEENSKMLQTLLRRVPQAAATQR